MEEKEKQLFQYWNDTKGQITHQTIEDWDSLCSHLEETDSKNHLFILTYLKYAAVIAVLILSVSTTYWINSRQEPILPTVELVELSVPYGKSETITLPDGSKVWLNAGSTLIYPSSFEHLNRRDIYLSGTASFDVYKNKEKPFTVKTSILNVEALGTLFSVEAYPNEELVRTILERGSIKVDIKDEKQESYILHPSERLTYSTSTREVSLDKVNPTLYERKRNGTLIFENETLVNILNSLERQYGVSFIYNPKLKETEYYNVRFNQNESIEDILKILNLLMDIDYKIIGNKILIK